jgi:F-type H+-transporting ATPase subunit delta
MADVFKRWARALMESLPGQAERESAAAIVSGAAAYLAASPGARTWFEDPGVETKDRKAAFASIARAVDPGAPAQAVDKASALMELLRQSGKLRGLPLVGQAFRSLVDADSGTARAFVETAAPLERAEAADLEAAVRARFGASRVAMEIREEPGLLGGLSVRVGDRLMDGSLRAAVERIGSRMRKGR